MTIMTVTMVAVGIGLMMMIETLMIERNSHLTPDTTKLVMVIVCLQCKVNQETTLLVVQIAVIVEGADTRKVQLMA